MADAQGAQSQLLAEPLAGSFDTSSENYEFLSENIQKTGTVLDSDGMRGTRSHSQERTREGAYTIGGTFTINPSPLDLDLWLPRILGAAESTDTFALAETLPTFGLMVDRVTKVVTYSGCYVNRAIFRGSGNEFMTLEIEIMGTDESVGNAGTAPVVALGIAAGDMPYHFSEAVVTLGVASAAREVLSFEIEINNFLEARFGNSLTATSITPQNRQVRLQLELPYDTANADLYAEAVDGALGTVVLTNAADSGITTTFSFDNLQAADISPVISGKTAVNFTRDFIARRLGVDDGELVITNDPIA